MRTSSTNETRPLKEWSRRLSILSLFTALVVVLLWFQGIILRKHHLTAEVPKPESVRASDPTAMVERRVLPELHVYPGFVEAIDPAEIAPRVMATIVELAGREGDAVEKGQVLVSLDDRDVRAKLSQARAAFDAAEAQALQSELAFERATLLQESEALTTQEWESARAARDASRAGSERARKAVEEARAALSWFELRAPFTGRILARHSDPGHLAAPGRTILSLYRESPLRLRVAVPEERVLELTVGTVFDVDFDGLPSQRAELTRVLPAADPATGTVTLHLILTAPEGVRPGRLGRLRLSVGEREALLVPRSAIERIGQIERVHLVRQGRSVPVTVRTGKTHEDRVEVLSGLSEGEKVRLR